MEDIFYIIGEDRAGHINEMEFLHYKNMGYIDVCECGSKGPTEFKDLEAAKVALATANASYLKGLYTFRIVTKQSQNKPTKWAEGEKEMKNNELFEDWMDDKTPKAFKNLLKGFKVGDWVRHDKLFGTYEITEIDTATGRVFMETAKGDGFFNSDSTAPEMAYCISDMTGWYVIDKPAPPKKHPLGLEPRSIWEEGVLAEREGERLVKINEAIKRYLDDDEMTIPEEWIEEYNEIKLSKRNESKEKRKI